MKFDSKKPRTVFQDGVRYELQNTLDNLTREMIGIEKAIFVACPVCLSNASTPILPKRRLQTVKCRNCGNDLTFKIMSSGKYKVRSEIGLEYVVGNERTVRESVFDK